ncbi:MAG: Dna2/Cas4 domain-containing protein [Anaerolineae bacterium]|nr:Dna2/Cas4 domain-containing protein [Anaerolineae bacterium]
MILGLALGLLLLGAYALWKSARKGRSVTGLPAGRVIYADTADWQRSESLFSAELGLAGKPDYIVRQGRRLVPVEVKPGRRLANDAAQPYDSDVMQLAAYVALVEDAFNEHPPYGLLRYRDVTFQIPHKHALRRALFRVLDDMRRDLNRRNVSRSHQDAHRCRFCGHRTHCGQSLE